MTRDILDLKLSTLMAHAKQRELRERDISILRDYLAGMKRADIAAKHGLSKAMIYYLSNRLVRYHERSPDPRHRLPDDIAAKLKELQEP